MRFQHTLAFFVMLGLSVPAFSEAPLACDVNALSASQRERHRALGERLANGYTLVLDLGRLPADSAGAPFCVVEVAEWVDLESRCCPFLDFGIDVSEKGRTVRLRLTGGKGVKAFLKTELGLLEASDGLRDRGN
jgi:hypothetical protein